MKFKVLLFLSFLCVTYTSASPLTSIASKRALFKEGLQRLARKASLPTDFKTVLSEFHLRHALRQNERLDIDNETLCMICEDVVNEVIDLLPSLDTEFLITYLVEICVLLDIESREVCDGAIRLNAGPVLYIAANRPNLRGEQVCAVVLQDNDCVGEVPEVTVNIPEGTTIEVEKGQQSDADPIKILQISDLHYDPHYLVGGIAECSEPLCCQSDKGLAEDQNAAAGYWGDYRDCDLPKHTAENALEHIKSEHPDIDYIFYTGDIISHRVWDTTQTNNSLYLREIYTTLQEAFPNIPVFPIIGNHEAHPTNSFAPPSVTDSEVGTNWLYQDLAEMWSAWLPEETKATITEGGYYTALVRPGFRVIALNSNVGYTYNWWILYEIDTINAQLQWLADTLLEAEQNGEFVHILSHVQSGDGTSYIPYSHQFWRIIERFANTITAIYNGHSHWDEWLLYHSESEPTKPIAIAWNGGSLTPFSNLNPNYKVYTVDGENFEVLDFESWTFNLTLANLTPSVSPNWFKLYSFKDVYELDNLSPQQIRSLLERATVDHSVMQTHYSHRYRSADTRGSCSTSCMLGDLCRMVTMVRGEATQCNEFTSMWN